ncbi:hypothetical protein [Dactylosporangium roseum]|uniref:hypothetical protein n=1 Tax=Dactylosporangium roseum TaxID=47989 RepID=UPI0028C3ACD4|nr:hypothetical protein [Dactylosporangium roseum]
MAALMCRPCGQQLVAELPSLADAERMLTEREARRWPALPPITIPRRRGGASTEEGTSASADGHPAERSPATGSVPDGPGERSARD